MTGGAGDQPPPYHSYVQSSPAQIYIEASFKNGPDEMPKLKKAVQFDKNRPKELSTVIEEIFYNDVAWNDIKCLAIAEKKSQNSEEFESVLSKYETTLCEDGAKYQVVFYDAETVSKKWLSKFVLELSPPPLEDPKGSKKMALVEEEKSKQSSAFLRVFKDNKFVVEDVFSFDPSTPHTFQDLIAYLDKKHNLVAKSSRFVIPTYVWFLKVAGENNYTEVDLNGVVENGIYYHVRVVTTVFLIKKDVSAYLKVPWTGDKKLQFQRIVRESAKKKTTATSSDRRVEDLDQNKREDVAPVQSLFYLRVQKNRRLVVHDAVPFDSSSTSTFQNLIDHISANHNVFAESRLFRQSIYVCIFKVVNDQKSIEVDLNGVVESGVTYHVHFSQSLFEFEDGVSAVFKISYGGHENKKHEFELIRAGSARDKKAINDNVNGRCEQFSRKEDQAALSAKREINIQVYKNGTRLWSAPMPITCSYCPSFKSLISHLNNKLKIFDIIGMSGYAWILKDIGENRHEKRHDEVDLEGVVEGGATYRVHFSNCFKFAEMLDVTAYFKLRYGVNEKLEFTQIVKEYLRRKKNKENVSGRLVEYEEISSRIQPEEDLIRFERGEIDLLLKTIKAEGLSRELPTILQDVPVPSKITSDSPKAITMVLLGETGVGKSTLINGMVNYIAYSSLSEAESNRPKYLIPARFLYDGKKILIGEQNANENIQLDGESATQRPTVYEFTENEQLYHIIDVPGIGDSRGVEQDRKNFDYILEEINRHEEINAFCILIPPNGSRITVATRFCIYELLSNLHKDAARNIVFCFTKARSTFYEGGDTLPILRDYLANLKSQQDVDIALDEDQNMYYFDNEPFKYLWLKENGICLDHQRKEYDRSFNVSRESTVKLFEYVRNLPPHDTTAMKALTETRRLILNMVPISAAASKKIHMNKSSLEDQIEKLKCSRYQKKSLQDHLYMDVYEIKTTPLEKPRTVCASATCIEKVPIGDGKFGQCNVLYKQICHDACELKSVTPGKYPDSALQGCATFRGGKCTECGCSWENHIHIKQLQEMSVRKAVNKELQKMLTNNDTQHLSIADVIKSYEVQLDELNEDEELIKKMSAKFSTFLRNNSMSIRNDVYADYLKHTLKMAEQELAVGGSYQKVAELQQSLHAYEAEVEFLMRSENSSGLVTIEEIFELKKELRALAERHGEIGDMLNAAEGVTAAPKKSKKKANGGGKTYNKSMLNAFL